MSFNKKKKFVEIFVVLFDKILKNFVSEQQQQKEKLFFFLSKKTIK